MSSPTFSFPPFHSFPPSFTRQPVASTLSKQSSLWCDLIRSFCRARRLFWLDLSSEAASALFENPSIGRRLSDEDVLFFLEALVSRGDGQWSTDKRSCLVYWRRPSEWGELVYQYVLDTGQGGDVFTVHEIRTKSEGYGGLIWGCSVLSAVSKSGAATGRVAPNISSNVLMLLF